MSDFEHHNKYEIFAVEIKIIISARIINICDEKNLAYCSTRMTEQIIDLLSKTEDLTFENILLLLAKKFPFIKLIFLWSCLYEVYLLLENADVLDISLMKNRIVDGENN